MNAEEALQIVRLAKAASPAQAVDDYTPDLWALVLATVRFEDARDAVVQLAAEQEWIHVSHIVKRVKRIRNERVAAFGILPDPPAEVGADEQRYSEWYAATVKRIADGEHVERPQLAEAERHHSERIGALVAQNAMREVHELMAANTCRHGVVTDHCRDCEGER